MIIMTKMFMKIFKNLFGNGDKIDSSEIATSDGTIIDNYIKPNILTIVRSSTQSITTSTTWVTTLIQYDTVGAKVGDKLTFENNGVKIGSGVSKVLISANCMTSKSGYTGYLGLDICKNSNTIIRTANYHTSTDAETSVSISSQLVTVSEGDFITAQLSLQNAGTRNIYATNNSTYLTVQVVE